MNWMSILELLTACVPIWLPDVDGHVASAYAMVIARCASAYAISVEACRGLTFCGPVVLWKLPAERRVEEPFNGVTRYVCTGACMHED